MNIKLKKILIAILFNFHFLWIANAEIPKKYKLNSSLPKCIGEDFRIWSKCHGKYDFLRGQYTGEWKDGNMHGKGKFIEIWGDIYEGNFKNNMADGFGFQKKKDGTEYVGEFKNNLYEGKGVLLDNNEIKIEGNFKNNLAHGKAKQTHPNGSIYEGDFERGLYHGRGIQVLTEDPDIIKYEGDFREGLRSGQGTFTYKDGSVYTGDVHKDWEHGYGIMNYAENSYGWLKYKGQWKGGYEDGEAELDFVNGDKYIGTFKSEGVMDTSFSGKGTLIFADGDKYVGEFIHGYMAGQGKYIYKSGTVYEGSFVKNKFEGVGTINYFYGNKYVGNFLNNLEHGKGELLYKNGDRYIGQFQNGLEQGQGKMLYSNGTIYEGLWKEGKQIKGQTHLAKFNSNEKYYALIIGNNEYENLEKLDNAVNDAIDIEKVLKDKYGFETTLLLNQTADKTLDALIEFTQNRKKEDNILIYYAGHGQLIKEQKRGYWLPVDAGLKQDSKWISNNNIKDLISSSPAKHILLVVDSCFAGSLMRGSPKDKSLEKLNINTLERLQKLNTRLVITSGGNEYVADGIGNSKNSVFAQPLIKALENNTDVIRSGELFQQVQNYVINNADQTPNHSLIFGTGHDGGEFLFFPKK